MFFSQTHRDSRRSQRGNAFPHLLISSLCLPRAFLMSPSVLPHGLLISFSCLPCLPLLIFLAFHFFLMLFLILFLISFFISFASSVPKFNTHRCAKRSQRGPLQPQACSCSYRCGCRFYTSLVSTMTRKLICAYKYMHKSITRKALAHPDLTQGQLLQLLVRLKRSKKKWHVVPSIIELCDIILHIIIVRNCSVASPPAPGLSLLLQLPMQEVGKWRFFPSIFNWYDLILRSNIVRGCSLASSPAQACSCSYRCGCCVHHLLLPSKVTRI